MLFLIGGARAAAPGRPRPGGSRDFALAGLVGGSAAMVRIDSYAGTDRLRRRGRWSSSRSRRPAVGRRHGRALARCSPAPDSTALLGWLDLVRLSQQYYDSQHHNITCAGRAARGARRVLLPLVVAVRGGRRCAPG